MYEEALLQKENSFRSVLFIHLKTTTHINKILYLPLVHLRIWFINSSIYTMITS